MLVPGEVFLEEMGLFHYLLHWRYFVWRKKFKLTTGEEKTLLYYIEELKEIEGTNNVSFLTPENKGKTNTLVFCEVYGLVWFSVFFHKHT